ncbi:unnamed protein product [Candida verbasci]|uniref:Uncharacterized protein n=1 Tax=Candida verbasci TaxID=1227364 RepID=A0A9W4TTH6_9ASCO|nr:unnamed protein product [Candida verbasci]
MINRWFTRKLRRQLIYWCSATIFAFIIFKLLLHFNFINSPGQVYKNQVIFPASFPSNEDIQSFVNNHKQFFNKNALGNPSYHKAVEEIPKIQQSIFKKYSFTVFNSKKDIDLNLKKCDQLSSKSFVEIDEAKDMKSSLHKILSNVLQEIEAGTNPYLSEIAPFLLPELRLQLKMNIVDKFWFKIAGSSVYLEDYGVHFMISRILYSPKGVRNQPIISLTYAQLFDKEWNELINTKLLVPTNDNSFKILQFPYFLPIPFYHDIDNITGKYYGPEDPRLILVKNKVGYHEPIVVFNAYHKRMGHFDDDEDELVLSAQFFRSMFLCWPWQFQQGKEEVGSESDQVYNKIVELKIKDFPKVKNQKNWTPFISHTDHLKNGYDSSIYFVYRWANLDIVKCNLDGSCDFHDRLNDKLSPKNQVGPLRGGTQLINLNQIAADIIPKNREIFIGFARAHLDQCGCGSVMYRPNLVIVVKDKVKNKELYKVSHVSSSLEFNLPVIGWKLHDPTDLCFKSNIVLPNGISQWNVDKIESVDGKWIVNDQLTMLLSLSDYTIHKLNIKGLLQAIIDLPDNSLFKKPGKENNDKMKKRLQIPTLDFETHKYELPGFNNDNIVCALQASVDYCFNYGLKQQFFKSFNMKDETLDDDEEVDESVTDPKIAEYMQLVEYYGLRGSL